MPTINQLVKTPRTSKVKRTKSPALHRCPQRRGVCLQVKTKTPKKPNSAKRKVAKIRLCTGKNLRVKIPGEGHGNLQKFSPVLIRGSHPRDLPGIRYSIIRGKLGSNPVFARRKGRSKYGVKKRHITENV